MSEKNVWAKLRTNLVGPPGSRKPWQEATRHEDKLSLGIADVSFVQDGYHGWMELKWLPDWPVRRGTIVRFPHFTLDQKDFLRKKGVFGGNVWLFCQIGGDHLLFDWKTAQEVGLMARDELENRSHRCWIGRRLNYEELAAALRAFRNH